MVTGIRINNPSMHRIDTGCMAKSYASVMLISFYYLWVRRRSSFTCEVSLRGRGSRSVPGSTHANVLSTVSRDAGGRRGEWVRERLSCSYSAFIEADKQRATLRSSVSTTAHLSLI